MKKIISLGVLFLILPLNSVSAAAYIKFDGVDGESKAAATTSATIQVQTQTASPSRSTSTTGSGSTSPSRNVTASSSDPQEASTDFYLEIDGVKGESSEGASSSKKGNVEYNWKVEEGEKMESDGVEPDEIDYDGESQPLTPDFSILLGGGGGDDSESVELEDELELEISSIILEGAKEKGAPVESISLNYDKIKATVPQSVKLFGFIPLTVNADVEVDAASQIKVQFPWWSFLVTGKDSDNLGKMVSSLIADVLQTKHDTIKNAIQNVR